MDPLRQNGPYNFGTHWGVDPYASGFGIRPYWNPYHGSMMAGLGDATTTAPDDIGSTALLHVVVAAGVGGAVAGFSSWDLSRAAVGAAALGGLAAGFDGIQAMTQGKQGLGLALIATGALAIFVGYTSARTWHHRYVRSSASAAAPAR